MARITKKEKQEIQRLRKNYLAKRSRLLKMGVPGPQLPTIPIITTSMPRTQVNVLKQQMRSFTSRSNSKFQFVRVNPDLIVSKHDIYRLKEAQRRANAKNMKIYKRNLKAPFIPLSERGWAVPGAHRTVKTDGYKKKPRGYTKSIATFRSLKELNAYIEHLNVLNQRTITDLDNQWRENTIEALKKTYGESMSQHLIAFLRSISLKEFVYLMETQDITITFIYDSLEIDNGFQMVEGYFSQEALKYYKG